ncbi:MAG: helix-turn-helix domain-containing protein [Acidiferrobacterales bacterium]
MVMNTIAQLVRTARNSRSQNDFARELGVRQSSVSRYESGKTSPPASVIEHCMRLVHTQKPVEAPTADDLADRVRAGLADPNLDQVRLALSRLIEVFINEHGQSRVSDSASR